MSVAHSLRVCFVAPAIYPVLSGDTSLKLIGGAEVQQNFLARELARRGHQVSVVCLDHGQSDGSMVDGIKVFRTHQAMEGLPVLRFIHPRFTSVWRAMQRADADIYYQRAGSALTGFVSAFARVNGRRSVFSSASDFNFDPSLPDLRFSRDKWLYRWGVRNASAVVVQSERQRIACHAMFGIESELISSCFSTRDYSAKQDGSIIWVGSVKAIKRPECFVALAKACPEYKFKMIGGGSDSDMEKLRCAASGLSNLSILGYVPFAEVAQHFDETSIHVNTSIIEGFPNTFMQAWAVGTPTVSFFDPEVEFEGERVGFVSRSFDEMVATVRRLKSDAVLWRAQSMASRHYLEEHHSIKKAVDSYESLFWRLLVSGQHGNDSAERSGR